MAFFNRQSRVALRHNGVIDPESIEEYFHYRGFQALAKVLEKNDPQWVIKEITNSKLRGRGGGGYPTGQKWKMGAAAADTTRYLVCNADEGDPGAFMDRSMLESDPLNVVEGMIIGGFAIGAQQGFFYVRAEYPMAIQRIQRAIEQCRQWGLLGRNILGSGFDFDLDIRLGAGAFVCGEETALIHSIEGERGQPRVRPPYPTEAGLWGKPTVINNVETFANVPAVINYGAEWFARLGTDKSGGTKVFALAGKVTHTGLVEVPMGTLLHTIVYEIGGGPAGGRQLKAIQTGGPAGGCIPAKWIDLAVDFDTLAKAGSIMGSGGMIILDEDDCMVDIAKFFMTFSQDESCGKCTPCREGTTRMLEILERITAGNGTLEDLDKLKRLGLLMRRASLCGLGRAAANPVLSTLEHFHDEYLAHVTGHRCPAHKCKSLIHYEIDSDKCVGCTVCAELSGDVHFRRAQGAAPHRPASLHQVRPLFRGLPLRRGETDVVFSPGVHAGGGVKDKGRDNSRELTNPGRIAGAEETSLRGLPGSAPRQVRFAECHGGCLLAASRLLCRLIVRHSLDRSPGAFRSTTEHRTNATQNASGLWSGERRSRNVRHTTTFGSVVPGNAQRAGILGFVRRRSGAIRGRGLSGRAVWRGTDHLRVAPKHAPRAAGDRRDRTGGEAWPGVVSDAATIPPSAR